MTSIELPHNFLWGAATSATRSRAPCTRTAAASPSGTRSAARPGTIADGDTGDVACDHYHRLREDVDLMATLGLGAYRFSVAWPRVLPDGRGAVNAAGLDFYDRLVDGLLARGITPVRDPVPLGPAAGAAGPRRLGSTATSVDAFAEYAAAVAGRLGDRVTHWITHNEPWCVASSATRRARTPPARRDLARRARRRPPPAALARRGRAGDPRRSRPAPRSASRSTSASAEPAPTRPADLDAVRGARRLRQPLVPRPALRRRLPGQDMRRALRARLDARRVARRRPRVIATPTDFLGINYYNPSIVRPDRRARQPAAVRSAHRRRADRGRLRAHGDGLAHRARRPSASCSPACTATTSVPAIYITENGAAFDDEVVDGRVDDPRRVAYLRRHLAACGCAIDDGVPRPRLLRLVADGQLRVGLRLRQALRPRPRRLRHAASARPKAQRALVPRRHRGQRLHPLKVTPAPRTAERHQPLQRRRTLRHRYLVCERVAVADLGA